MEHLTEEQKKEIHELFSSRYAQAIEDWIIKELCPVIEKWTITKLSPVFEEYMVQKYGLTLKDKDLNFEEYMNKIDD